jgi:uncharacterized membrane protein
MLAVERRLSAVDPTLLATAIVAVACALLMLIGMPVGITAAAGALLGLVLPGYALTRVLFPGRTDGFERVALALGIGLSVDVAAGFLLHLLPTGLSAGSWGLLLATITVAACVIAARRDARLYRPAPPAIPAIVGQIPPVQYAMLAGALVLVGAAVFVARFGEGAQPHPGTTALWVRPDADGSAVRLGVVNTEGRSITYRVEVSVDGAVVARLDTVSVGSGASRETRVGLPATGEARDVAVRVWRSDDPKESAPYRQVGVTVAPDGAAFPDDGIGDNPPPLVVDPGDGGVRPE